MYKMIRTTRLFVAVLMLGLLASTATAAAPATKAYQDVADGIAASLSRRDAAAFNAHIDSEAILDTALKGLVLDAGFKRSTRASLKKAIESQLGEKIIGNMPEDAYAKLVRLKPGDGLAYALVRVDYGDYGTGYMDFHLAPGAGKKVRIVDWYDYSTGQPYTQSLRQLVVLMSPSPTAVGKLFDLVSSRKEHSDAVAALLKQLGEQNYTKVVHDFLAMDETLRKNRMLNIVAVQAANQSDDEELYRRALANVDRYFGGEPSLAFLLLDYYFMEGEHDKALAALEQTRVSFGAEDASIMSLKANLLTAQGKPAAAMEEARRAISTEPEYEQSYWSWLDAAVNLKAYGQAVAAARDLESRFGYDLGPDTLASVESYSGFAASREYRSWKGVR